MPPAEFFDRPARHRASARACAALLAVAAVVTAAGCSSGSHAAVSSHAPTTSQPPATSPASSPSAPATQGGRPLSRAAFVARANAMCRTETKQIVHTEHMLTGLSSVDGFTTDLIKVLTANAQAFSTLIAAQPDHVILQRRWLEPRLADYAAEQRQLMKLRADADRGDAPAAQADLTALTQLPNHDKSVNAFLRSYGITACT